MCVCAYIHTGARAGGRSQLTQRRGRRFQNEGGRNSIHIAMQSGGKCPTVMKTQIPKILDIQPAFVFWKQGEVPDIKTIDLKVGLTEAMHITKASSGLKKGSNAKYKDSVRFANDEFFD